MTALVEENARAQLRIVTPEGVALDLRIPDTSERLAAFVYDFAMVFLGTMTIVIVGGILAVMSGRAGGVVLALVVVTQFLFFNGYYIYFEGRPRGATPGKRRLGMRVIDRRGGALRTEQIVARNLVRNFEFLLPLAAAGSYAQLGVVDHAGKVFFCIAVVIACAISPVLTRDRLRVGDWLAGTLVVASPEAKLLQDLGRARGETATHEFSREHLAIYGVYELQVLEDLLRSGSGLTREKAEAVAVKIRKKIGWHDPVDDPKLFLREFYTAQRAHLERELVLGRRKESKSDTTARS